ncbi:MAG TPA: hypothetical protein VFE24_12645 [Pirellulales bacterium]|jgi:hypothetical protein|nr:hypothetical protein [Pirellulales bacterium]
MQEPFDPYRAWLGIPPPEQPPNFYRLLGLPLFEANIAKITKETERRVVHLRKFQTGPHAAPAQKLTQEILAARDCLIHPDGRAQYDAMLRSMGWGAAPAAPPIAAAARAVPPVIAGGNPQAAPQAGGPYAAPLVATPVAGVGSAGVPLGAVPVGAAPLMATPVAVASDPFDPLGLSAPNPVVTNPNRTIIQRKKKMSPLPFILGGGILVAVLVAVAIIVNNSNKPAPAVQVAANGTTAPTAPDKSLDKKLDKSADKTADSGAKGSDAKAAALDPNAGAKPGAPQTAAKASVESDKMTGDAPGKEAGSAPSSGATASKRPDRTAKADPALKVGPPIVPKHAEGEVPDYGPLPPLASNDTALDLAALPPPTASSMAPVLAELKPQWKEDLLKAVTPEDQQAFLSKLINQAGAARADLPKQYVLLKAAYNFAIELGDADTFVKVADQLAAAYAVDPWETKVRGFQRAGNPETTPAQYLLMLGACEKLITTAMAAGKIDVALNLTKAGAVLAARGKSPADAKRLELKVVQMEQSAKETALANQAEQTLASRRNDPAANLTLGSYLCFIKGDWLNGVSYLRKSDDLVVKSAADLEASNPFAADKQAEVGDAWFELAKKYQGYKRNEILRHAKEWYNRAIADLTGDAKKEAAAKLQEIDKLSLED